MSWDEATCFLLKSLFPLVLFLFQFRNQILHSILNLKCPTVLQFFFSQSQMIFCHHCFPSFCRLPNTMSLVIKFVTWCDPPNLGKLNWQITNCRFQSRCISHCPLKCIWIENYFYVVITFSLWNTWFRSFRRLGQKLAKLQALKVPLFYPQKWSRNSRDWGELWRNFGCKSLFTFSDIRWVLAAPKDKRCLVIRKASRNQEKVEIRGKEPPYWILNWSCNQNYVTSRDILTFWPRDLKTIFQGKIA